MHHWEITYNTILSAADILLLIYHHRKKSLIAIITGFLLYGGLSVALAFLFSPDNFGALRLLCYTVFIHGFLLSFLFFFLLFNKYKFFAIISAAAGLLIVFSGIDAFFIEPHSLIVSRVNMKSAKLKEPLKIVVFSDFQADEISDYEKNAIDLSLAEKPDILLLPGDYIQTDNVEKRKELYSELNKLLKEKNFAARFGIYAVNGNVDERDWPKIFEGSYVTCATKLSSFENESFVITCLNLEESFGANIHIPVKNKFHIVLGHAPDFALANPDADLLIAGHTHGGQVRIPFLGPIFTLSKVPSGWASGVTDIDADTKLIVSRGIGMERGNAPPIRFFCKPEIVVVTVMPE